MNVDSPARFNVQETLMQVKNDTNEDYKDHLMSAFEFVLPDDAPSFFHNILDSFHNKNMSEEAGLQVFKTIRTYLHIPEFFDIFADNTFLLQLPFDTENQSYIEQIFNIVYDIIQINPSKIQSPFGDYFTKVIEKDPLKGLSIINQFANKVYGSEYEGTSDPWTLIDILFNSHTIFMSEGTNTNEIFIKFGYVVIFILKTYPDYRNQRLFSYWKLFIKSLEKTNDPNSLYTIYNILCFIKDLLNNANTSENDTFSNDISNSPLPQSTIAAHLDLDKRLRGPIFSLLGLYSTTNPELLNHPDLVSKLVTCSKKSIKASLILMNIASVQETAAVILSLSKKWLEKGLPEPLDTLRLFLVVFQHTSLHGEIIKNKRFIPFLIFVLKNLESCEILPLVNLILARITITPPLFAKIRSSELIPLFIDIATKYDDNDNVSEHAVLVFMCLMIKHGAAEDLLSYIPLLSNMKGKDELQDRLSFVVYQMAKTNVQCLSGLVDADFRNYYLKLIQETKSDVVRKNGKKFLKLTKD